MQHARLEDSLERGGIELGRRIREAWFHTGLPLDRGDLVSDSDQELQRVLPLQAFFMLMLSFLCMAVSVFIPGAVLKSRWQGATIALMVLAALWLLYWFLGEKKRIRLQRKAALEVAARYRSRASQEVDE